MRSGGLVPVLGGLLSLAWAASACATPITPVVVKAEAPRPPSPGLMSPVVRRHVASDADYWTILLLQSSDEQVPREGLLDRVERDVTRVLKGWREALVGAGDEDVDEDAEARPLTRINALLRHLRLADDPVIEEPARFLSGDGDDIPLFDEGLEPAAGERGDRRPALLPLSQLFLRKGRSGAGWLGGGNRFLTGPIDEHRGRRARVVADEVDLSGSLANVSEWIDALLHFRPGLKTWLFLFFALLTLVLLRILHHRGRDGP